MPKMKPKAKTIKWKGTNQPTPDELIASGDKKAIRYRLMNIENDISLWQRFFNWPALFESFEREAERLRAALRD